MKQGMSGNWPEMNNKILKGKGEKDRTRKKKMKGI
jgi:hypothetical protein